VTQGIDLGVLDPTWHIVGLADFNQDGAPDILLENVSSGQRVLWLMGGPNNAYVTQGLDLGSLDPAWHIAGTADFNGDGRPDILLENTLSGQRVLWLMGGPNNAYVAQGLDLGLLPPVWHIVALADFNRDGSPDILLENTTTGQRVLWLMGGPNNAYVMTGLDLGSLDPVWSIVQ
ncbi:MAG: VCBS repeat-containing protein, partial [Bryocella sp.]